MTLPNNPTFDFALSGVSSDLTFGKQGPRIASINGELQFLTSSGQPGNITVNQGYFTNIGIGTTSIGYPLDVYGNIHIGNTATISGIIYPDGSFQDTAAKNTPSFGLEYTIQFAGIGNTFSGDSSHLVWDAVSTGLVLPNGANATIGGYALANQIISNNNVFGATLQSSGTALLNALIANTDITTSALNVTSSALVASLNSNTHVTATNLQSTGTASVDSLISNTNTTTATLNTTGAALVNSLNSNTNVVGANLQSTGLAAVQQLISNTNVFGATLQSSGQALVNSLIGNNNVFGATLQSQGQATVGSLVSNGSISGGSISAGPAVVQSLTSNTFVQAAGQVTAQTMVSNTSISAGSLITGNQIRSNGFVEGATLKTTGLAQVSQLITNTEVTASTLNVITAAVVQLLESNTTIQAGTLITGNQIYGNLNITSQNMNALTRISADNVTANTSLSSYNFHASGLVTIANTTQSYGPYDGALTVAGGVGIGGNLNVEGDSRLAGNVLIIGNLVVQGNSTIINTNVISVLGPTIEVGSDSANNPPLTYNDGYDRGIILHYYDTEDDHGFMGWQNSTGRFVYMTNVQPGIQNVINPFDSVPGFVYGTGQFGDLALSNITISSDYTNGALRVTGGAGIAGNLNVNGQIATNDRIRAIYDIQSNGIRSNSFVSAGGLITGDSLHSNTNVDATNISATNQISGFLLAANSSVTSPEVTALNNITGNVLVGNLSIQSPYITATTLLTGQAINSNTTIQAINGITGDTLHANTNIWGDTLNINTLAQTQALINNTIVSSNTLQVTSNAVVGGLTSNTFIQSAGSALVNYLESNTIVQTPQVRAYDVQAAGNVVANQITGNVFVIAPLISGNTAIFNSVNAVTIGATVVSVSNLILADQIFANTTIQSHDTIFGNAITSNSFIQAGGAGLFGSVTANTTIQAGYQVIGNVIVGNVLVTGDAALFATVHSTGNIIADSYIQGNAIYGETLVQSQALLRAQDIVSNSTIQSAGDATFYNITSNVDVQANGAVTAAYINSNGMVVGGGFYSNTFVQAAGSIVGNDISSNTLIQATGEITAGGNITTSSYAVANHIVANVDIRSDNLIVINISQFNVITASGSITSNTYIQGNQFIANVNVGIGTNTIGPYALDIYGNVHIGNTATISGIIFSDGTFQDTAAKYTPSFGYPSTVQFAGSDNTFSGDSTNFTWDNVAIRLNTSNLYVSSNVQSVDPFTGALTVTGGTGISGDLYVAGNIIGSNITVITGNTGSFFGDTYGFNALYAGITTGYVFQPDTVAQFSANVDDFAQINLQNINPGPNASTDIVATADNGTYFDGYINMGINSSGWAAAGNADQAGDGYLFMAGNAALATGNLVIGVLEQQHILFTTGGDSTANIIASLDHDTGLHVYATTPSMDYLSGALLVDGGTGIDGNLFVSGEFGVPTINTNNITVAGFAQVQTLSSNTLVSGNTWVLDGTSYTSTSSFQQIVDTWPISAYRTAQYLIQITDTTNTKYQAAQVMLIHDDTDVFITEYGDIYSNGSLGEFEADISAGYVQLYFTPISSATMIIKSVRTTIDA